MGKECNCRKLAEFRDEYRRVEKDEKSCFNCCRCTKKRALNCVNSLFPIYRILKKYKWKTDFLADVICGLTVGIMQLPQGMAYAMLAELPPVVGLYMSFFPVLIYVLLGTSKHISMGTVAVVSLLTGSVIARFYPEVAQTALSSNVTDGNGTAIVGYVGDDETPLLPTDMKIGIAVTLGLLVGITQIIMGTLRMGFVTTYMSDPLVSGFTTASAVHVGTSQVKYIFGLKIPRSDGLFQVIKTYKYIIERITNTNIATLVMSLICIIIIYLVKVHINQRFKSKLKVPIPIELLVVIAGTLASYFGKFHDKFHMYVVGDVPAGLPTPSVPSFKGVDKFIPDIFIIAIVSFAQSVSLAALMAKKHRYTIDSNQELIATGAGNIFGSFFSCYPMAASVSRSSVQESAGGKTQLATVFSASLVLIVILWVGPLFESLPNCVLSAIIVVALRSLLLQVLELPSVWKTSKYDFWIWVVTCVCTTVLHVDYGLLIGLVFSFFTVVLRSQKSKPTRLGKIVDEKVYQDPKTYIKAVEQTTVKIIRYQSPLYFANGDIFVKEVYRLSTVKPERLRKQIRRASEISRRASLVSNNSIALAENNSRKDSAISISSNSSEMINGLPFLEGLPPGLPPFVFENPINHIILDFSAVTFTDTVGCKVLKQLIQDYDAVNIRVFIASVSDEVWDVFVATQIVPTYQNNIFLTVEDAIEAANTVPEATVPDKSTHM